MNLNEWHFVEKDRKINKQNGNKNWSKKETMFFQTRAVRYS